MIRRYCGPLTQGQGASDRQMTNALTWPRPAKQGCCCRSCEHDDKSNAIRKWWRARCVGFLRAARHMACWREVAGRRARREVNAGCRLQGVGAASVGLPHRRAFRIIIRAIGGGRAAAAGAHSHAVGRRSIVAPARPPNKTRAPAASAAVGTPRKASKTSGTWERVVVPRTCGHGSSACGFKHAHAVVVLPPRPSHLGRPTLT